MSENELQIILSYFRFETELRPVNYKIEKKEVHIHTENKHFSFDRTTKELKEI